MSAGGLYGHDETKLFLEAFKKIEVAISGLNPDPVETIAQYRKRQLRSEMLNATAVVSSLLAVLVAFFALFTHCWNAHRSLRMVPSASGVKVFLVKSCPSMSDIHDQPCCLDCIVVLSFRQGTICPADQRPAN